VVISQAMLHQEAVMGLLPAVLHPGTPPSMVTSNVAKPWPLMDALCGKWL
jgi:hypothetical protein